MNYKTFFLIFLLLQSCTVNQIVDDQIIESKVYSNKGFALLYNEDLKKQTISLAIENYANGENNHH